MKEAWGVVVGLKVVTKMGKHCNENWGPSHEAVETDGDDDVKVLVVAAAAVVVVVVVVVFVAVVAVAGGSGAAD